MIATTAVAITMIDVTIDATIEVGMIDERIEVGIAATEKMDTSKGIFNIFELFGSVKSAVFQSSSVIVSRA